MPWEISQPLAVTHTSLRLCWVFLIRIDNLEFAQPCLFWMLEVETKPLCLVPTPDHGAVQGWAFEHQHCICTRTRPTVRFVCPQAELVSLSSWSSSAEGHKDLISGMGHPTVDPWKMDWWSGMALKAFLAMSPLNSHHWCTLERVWNGSERARSVVLVCNAETPLFFLVLCSELQENASVISAREKGHRGGSWSLLLMVLQRGGDTGSPQNAFSRGMSVSEKCQLLAQRLIFHT